MAGATAHNNACRELQEGLMLRSVQIGFTTRATLLAA